jgi:hypothetical protein
MKDKSLEDDDKEDPKKVMGEEEGEGIANGGFATELETMPGTGDRIW